MKRAIGWGKYKLGLAFWAGSISLAIVSCEKNIDLSLKETAPKLVVEATIENGQPPVVVLTNSLSYFSKLSPQILAASFVHGAIVVVGNGARTHRLKEYSTPLSAGLSFYYYSVDSANLSTAFLGEVNKNYTLQISSSGKDYSAATTIPRITKVIDSVWWKRAPAQTDTTKIVVMVKATDPPGFGDYVRYFTKRNNGPFLPPANSAFDDLFVDGTTYEVRVDPGIDRNNPPKEDENYFHRGDTLNLKLSNIDKATFDFWRTMEYSYQSVGNPFSTPTTVLGNISGDALGYFGGYATQYRTLIIPR